MEELKGFLNKLVELHAERNKIKNRLVELNVKINEVNRQAALSLPEGFLGEPIIIGELGFSIPEDWCEFDETKEFIKIGKVKVL